MVDFTYYLSAVGYSWTLTPKPTLFIQGSNQEKVKVTIIAITFAGHPESVLAVVNDSVVDTNVGKGKEEDGSDVDDREEIPGVPEQFRSRLDIQKWVRFIEKIYLCSTSQIWRSSSVCRTETKI